MHSGCQAELGKSLHGMSEALGLTSQCSKKTKSKDYQEGRVARQSGLTEQPMSSSVEGSSGVFNKEGNLLTCFTKIILAVLRLWHRPGPGQSGRTGKKVPACKCILKAELTGLGGSRR